MAEPQPLTSLEALLFEAPLYAVFKLPDGKWWKGENAEGHCPFCKRQATFKIVWKDGDIRNRPRPYKAAFDANVICRCTRQDEHNLQFVLRLHDDTVQKWGQLPSFADITESSTKQYRGVLSQQDARELNRASGLAAHGVGIGALVYVRRIFERIIDQRFAAYKDAENWDEVEFRKLRMDERIGFMKGHLPDFLVKNRRMYSILSLGIHELEESDCLSFFPVARSAIIFILDEDHRKKEELAEREAAQKAIAGYQSPDGSRK